MSLGHIIHAKECFTIMIFRHVHLSICLMNSIKTGSRPAPTEPVPDGGESEDEEEDPYVAEASGIKTRLQIRRELEL